MTSKAIVPMTATGREQLKLAREVMKHEKQMAIITNPVFQIVGATVAIEALQKIKVDNKQPVVGEVMGTIAEIGVIVAVASQQNPNALPAITNLAGQAIQTTGNLAGSVIGAILSPLKFLMGKLK